MRTLTSSRMRTAVVVRADTPELPFLASVLQAGFTAVVREGWSVIVADSEVDPQRVVAAGGGDGICAVVSSDGTERELTLYPPLGSPGATVGDPAAQLTEIARTTTLRWGGNESAGEDDATRGTELAVESIASVADLDPAATSRLRNYAHTASSSLLLESVLQLLHLPVIAAKLVEGQQELDGLEEAQRFEPQPLGTTVLDAMTVEPTGADIASRLYRLAVRRPEVLLALGGAEAAAGSTLALLASRRGRGARMLGTASAVLLADAAGQVALWSAIRRRRTR